MRLWEQPPGLCEEMPTMQYVPSVENTRNSDKCILCFPGGAYSGRASYEGIDYARFFATNGYTAFAVNYRVAPHRHPLPLLDARRAVRFVRAHADQYGIDKEKIAVIGSSAGGHLCASLSTIIDPLEGEGVDEIDKESFLPNAQILCYPVIRALDDAVCNRDTYRNLLGHEDVDSSLLLDPSRNVGAHTPPAFIWHTSDDAAVNVINSYKYGIALREKGIPHELHVFPHGPHGLGLSLNDSHVGQWKSLVLNWLKTIF